MCSSTLSTSTTRFLVSFANVFFGTATDFRGCSGIGEPRLPLFPRLAGVPNRLVYRSVDSLCAVTSVVDAINCATLFVADASSTSKIPALVASTTWSLLSSAIIFPTRNTCPGIASSDCTLRISEAWLDTLWIGRDRGSLSSSRDVSFIVKDTERLRRL